MERGGGPFLLVGRLGARILPLLVLERACPAFGQRPLTQVGSTTGEGRRAGYNSIGRAAFEMSRWLAKGALGSFAKRLRGGR